MQRPRPVPIALGLLSGALICAALPPWGWWPLAPLGVALWLHLLAEPSRSRRFAVGWAVGVAWFGPSTLWMWGLTPPGFVLGVLLFWGPLVGLLSVAAPPDPRRLAVLPAGIVLFEWFHSHAPFGGVPLSLLAMTQSRGPLLSVATVGGSLALSGAVAAAGVALYLAVSQRVWRAPAAIIGAVVLVALAGVAWPVGENLGTLRVAVVQGGGPQGTRFTSTEAPLVYERHLEATRSIDASRDLDLVVWPENAINVNGSFVDSFWLTEIAEEARRLDATIVVGAVEDVPQDPDAFYNFALVVGPDGSVGDRYDKERRVPFGEYVPLRPVFEPIAAEVLPPRDQVPGQGVATLDTEVGSFAVAISWEVFFPRRVREGVREGGEVVLNPTNGSSYWLTQVQTQQIATSALRAAESRRWLLQAAPTGFSAVIDERGRVLQRTGVSEQEVLFADVPRRSVTTPAQALGDLPAMLAAGAILLWAFRRSRSAAAI